MNKFDLRREKLDKLTKRIQTEGLTKELEQEWEELCSELAFTLMLGPNDSLDRGDKKDRDIPDEKDLWYYDDTFKNIDYAPFFRDDELGKVTLIYTVREIENKKMPFLRITYSKKYLFFNRLMTVEFKSELDSRIKYFTSVLGCRWYDGRIEVVDTFSS